MCRSIVFVGILALVVVNLQSVTVNTVGDLVTQLNKPNTEVQLNGDIKLGTTSVGVTSTGSSLERVNVNSRLTFDGTGVLTCNGIVEISVDVVIGTTGTQNFFSAGSGSVSNAKITLSGNTIFVEKAVSGTLFHSNGGVIDFNDVTVRNTATQPVISFGGGFFFSMGSGSAGKDFTFAKLKILGLNKTSSTAVFDLSQARASITFDGCEFSNFNVLGSVIDDSVNGRSGLSIKHSVFQGIKRTGSGAGGVLYIHGGGSGVNDLRIDNTTFDKCSTTSSGDKSDGGVLYYASTNAGTTLTIDLCTFLDTSSQKTGGAIFASLNGRLYLINCTFDHCSAKGNGGVLHAWEYAVEINTPGITVQTCIFQNCQSTSGSGGVFYYIGNEAYQQFDSQFTIVHCDFFYCSCFEDGGVGYFRRSCKAKCNESVFYSCSAGGKGGAIKMFWSGMELANCTFSKCHAKFGGACNFLMNVDVFFYDCLLIENSADKFGGAVAFERRTDRDGERPRFMMRGCYLTGNTLLDTAGYGLDIVFMEDNDNAGTGAKSTKWQEALSEAYAGGNFTGTYSSTVAEGDRKRIHAFYSGSKYLDPSEYLPQWVPVTEIKVSTSGANSQYGCGYGSLSDCREIAYASSRINIAFDYTVHASSGVFTETLITVQLKKRLTVLGYGRGDPFKDGGTRIIPQYDRFYSALFICHYPESGLILNALSYQQSVSSSYSDFIRSAVYLSTPDATGFLKIIDCCFFSPVGSGTFKGCLIYSMGHDVTVEDSTFDNFTTNAEHGGVIRFSKNRTEIVTSLSLRVVNTEFISCKINDGNGEEDSGINGGGAVYVEGSAVTNFTLVRFEYCVGRALVLDYGRSEENSNHLFDKCVFVNNKAVLDKSSENPDDFKGSALACLYVTKSAAYVPVYFDHCYFGGNTVTKGGSVTKGHDAGFITNSSNPDQTQNYWNTLIEYTWSKYDDENPKFWDCYSDGEDKRVWTSSTSLTTYYANPRLRGILDYYFRPSALRVSHTSVGFNGEYCGCDHVPCNTIAYTYTRAGINEDNSTYPEFHVLWVAPVVNNETAELLVIDRSLKLVRKNGEQLGIGKWIDKWRVSPEMELDPDLVVVGIEGSIRAGAVLVYVSQNDSVEDFIHVKGSGVVLIEPTSADNGFHFLHNSTGGKHSLFEFESTGTSKLTYVTITDGTAIIPASPRPGALTRGLVLVSAGTVELKNAAFYSLLVSNGGAGIHVKGNGILKFETSEVGNSAKPIEGDASSDNACFLRLEGNGDASVTGVNFHDFRNVHVVKANLQSGGKLVIVKSEFKSCTSVGNGGAIYVELGENGELKLNDTGANKNKFEGCSASANGYGGAIFLFAKECATNFDFSGITFIGNSATKGKNIYVHAKELREIIVPDRFKELYTGITQSQIETNNLKDTTPAGKDDLSGALNDTLNGAVHIPLVYFFYRYVGTLYIKADPTVVNNGGYDREWCGRDILPCRTVSEASDVVNHPGVSSFILDGTVTLYDKLLDIPGPPPKRTVSKYNELEATTSVVLHSVTITPAGARATLKLDSTVPNYKVPGYLYSGDGINLNLSTLDIKPAYRTFSLSGGSELIIFDCQVWSSNEFHVHSSIFKVDGGITITNSVFSSLSSSSTAAYGAVAIHATIPATPTLKSFTILNSNFTNIVSGLSGATSLGGAIYVSLSGKFTIEEIYSKNSATNFSNCIAGPSGGIGGGVYLDLVSTTAQYVFGGLINFNYEDSGNQNHFYIKSPALSRKVVNRNTFKYPQYSVAYDASTINERYKRLGFLTLHGLQDPVGSTVVVELRWYLIDYPNGEVYVSSQGTDSGFCGFYEKPCETIKRAIENAVDSSLYSMKVGVFEYPTYSGTHNFDFVYPVLDPPNTIINVNVTGIVWTLAHTNIDSHTVAPLTKILATSAEVSVLGSLTFTTNVAVKSKSTDAVGNAFIRVGSGGFLNVSGSGTSEVGTGSSFEGISAGEQVIVINSGAGAFFKDVEFTSLTSTKASGGTGSALLATIARGKSLTLIGCRFDGCKTAAGSNGAAIHVTLNSGGIFHVSGTADRESTFKSNGGVDGGGINPLTDFGGGIYLALQTGFILDSMSSYFEFVGNLTFSEDPGTLNKAGCGYNIFIKHASNNYEEIINRQSFDFLLSIIEAARVSGDQIPGFEGFVTDVDNCEDVTPLVMSLDPVYVSSDGKDALEAPAVVECSRAYPCLTIKKAADISGGTFSGANTRSVNVKLIYTGNNPAEIITIDPAPVASGGDLVLRKTLDTGPVDINAYSFKGIALSTTKQESAEQVVLSITNTFNFGGKASFENIIFPKAADHTAPLFTSTPGSAYTLSNCLIEFKSASPPLSLSSGLFTITSEQFKFASQSAITSVPNGAAASLKVQAEPAISITGSTAGNYEFSNAVFAWISLTGKPLLYLNRAESELNVLNCNVVNISGTTATTASVFEIVQGKKITISGSTFKGIGLADGAGVWVSGKEVIIVDSTFVDITRTTGNGGAIYTKIPDDGVLTLNFSGSTSFGGCAAAKGKNIYLHAPNELASFVDTTSFSYTDLSSTLTAGNLNFYSFIIPLLNTLEGDSDEWAATGSIVSLFYYLLDPTPVYASPDHTAFSKCGFFTYPCNTISTAIERGVPVNGILSINVVTLDASKLNPALVLSSLPTSNSKTTINGYVLSGVERYISTNTYTGPPALTKAPLAFPAAGITVGSTSDALSVAVKYITIKGYGNVFTFNAGASSLSLDNVEIIDVDSTVSIISYSSSGPLNVIDSVFDYIKVGAGSVISVNGDFKNVAIESSKFIDITSSGNGAAISATADSIKSLTIKQSHFSGCESTGGNGGALYVVLTNGGAFAVEDGSFKDCSATGSGGAVYLKLGSGFNLLGNSSFVFKDSNSSEPPVLEFASNTATVYGNNIFIDGSSGTDLSSVVIKPTTFDFQNLKAQPDLLSECNDWMGYSVVNTDVKWLNRYFDGSCYLAGDGCPSANCVLDFTDPSNAKCVEDCPTGFEKEEGQNHCIQNGSCESRAPRPLVVTIPALCSNYVDPYSSECGADCFYVDNKCTSECPEHTKKDGDKCRVLECEEQVVCPDGKISKEDTCVNDTCVSEDVSKGCGSRSDCVEVKLKTKDIFGVVTEQQVCRSNISSAYKEEHSLTQCGVGPGGQCYLDATKTGINRCITNCTEQGNFYYVSNLVTKVCSQYLCSERDTSTGVDPDKTYPCGEDCYYFEDYVEAEKKTTTRDTKICMDGCPQFYYDKNGEKKCEIIDCTDRTYGVFICPEGEECGPGKNPAYPEDNKTLTCGPNCSYKNYSTLCDTECDPHFFDAFPWDATNSKGDGWGHCDLKLCPDRVPRSTTGDECKEFTGEECFVNQFDKCDENGNLEGTERDCVYYQKEMGLLVGGKVAEDTAGCGAGDRPNCKTVSYAVSRAAQSCDKAKKVIPIILVTADVIETARAAVKIDITGIELRSQSSVKRLTINMVYRASFVVGPYDKPTTITNLIFNTFTIRDTKNYAPLFYTVGDTPLGSLTLNGVTVNYAVSSSLAQTPTFINSGFSAWAAQLKGITVNFNKSLINNRVVELPPSAVSLSSFLSSSAYRLTRLDLFEMFDLDFSDDPEFEAEFLDRFSPVIVSLATSTLASRSLSSFNKQSNEHTGVCLEPFPNPAVLLSSLNGSFEYSNFSNINTGAIKLEGTSNVTLNGVAFFQNRIFNSPQQEELPSMRHNVYVSDGTTITVINLISESSGSFFLQDGRVGDGLERIIVAKDGSAENNVITPFNELFTPIFTDSMITPSDDGGSFILTLRGGMFFPCDPILVLYRDAEELGKYKYADSEFSISGETSISVNITVNAENYFEPVGEYKALLQYEPYQRSALFTYNTVYGIPPQKAKANLQPLWWILVALGILILLLLALVIFLYIRMKLKQKELEQDAAEARIRAQVRRDQQINKQRADQRKLQEKKTVKEPVKKADRIFANDINSNEDSFGAWEAGADEWVVDARRCEHPFGVVQCDRRRTLFALYTELSAQALNTSSPQETFQSMLPQKLRNPMAPMLGLAQLMNRLYQENPNVPVDHISPHTLLVSTKGSLALVLKKDAVKNMTGEGREVGGAFESIRWNAPELKFEETPTLASDIFSYSLVAWQIATPMHEVPFAEVDAQSASTRMATGYRPVTQGLDYRLVGLFENAWKQEPDERSTVQEIIDTLQAGGSAGGGDQWDGDGSSAKGGGANSGWKAPLLNG